MLFPVAALATLRFVGKHGISCLDLLYNQLDELGDSTDIGLYLG